jgi:hypothetical protein
MSALDDYKLLWNAALVQWQRMWFVRSLCVLAGLLAFIGVGIGAASDDWVIALRVGVGVPMLLLQLIWAIIVIPGLAMMNTPANARLVPRIRRRMVELTVGGWIAAGVCCLLTPIWFATPLVVLWVMSMSGGRSGSRTASVMVVIAAMWGTIIHNLPPPVVEFAESAPGTAVFCALVAAYGAWMIRAVLPNGGDRHFSQRKRQTEVIKRFQSMGRKQPGPDRQRIFSPYGFVLQRAIKVRKASTLILLGLGQGTHWTGALSFCAVILVAGAGAHLLFGAPRHGESSAAGWVLLLTVVLIVQGAFFGSWKALVASARNEAALLKLVPLCANARTWNRSFGAALVRNALAYSALAILTTIAIALFDGVSADELLSLCAVASIIVMPGVAWMLRDQSRESEERTLSTVDLLIRVLPATFVAMAGLVAMLGLQAKIGALAWVLLAAASNTIGALAALYYWREMMAAPAGFPARPIA